MQRNRSSFINDYLYYSYVPDPSIEMPDAITESAEAETHTGSLNSLLNTGAQRWRETIDSLVTEHADIDQHIVPLSSGWDSRFILAELLQHVPKETITTYTFGVPGAWDFDLGASIAANLGIEHIPINLHDIRWSRDTLERYIASRDRPTRFFEVYCQQYAIDQLDTENTLIWSGFIGGTVSGSHFPNNPTDEWTQAQEWFSDFNKRTDLAPKGYNPTICLPENPYLSRKELTYEEQLDFSIRQFSFVKPTVMTDNKSELVFPFLQSKWLSFVLNIPEEQRHEQRFFLQLFESEYPEIYSFPSAAAYARSPTASLGVQQASRFAQQLRWRVQRWFDDTAFHRGQNYINFGYALRNDSGFQETIGNLLADIRNRDAVSHIDVSDLWRSHQLGNTDNSAELRVLACIELWLTTHEK